MTNYFVKNAMVDCWEINQPPLDFCGASGRGRRPWPFQCAPSSGTARHDRRHPQSPPPLPWLIVMFLAPPCSIWMEPIVGGITYDHINARHRLERARAAHRQKKEPKPLTRIVSPGFCVTNFCFLFFSPRL